MLEWAGYDQLSKLIRISLDLDTQFNDGQPCYQWRSNETPR